MWFCTIMCTVFARQSIWLPRAEMIASDRVKVHWGYYLRAVSIALKMGCREATIWGRPLYKSGLYQANTVVSVSPHRTTTRICLMLLWSTWTPLTTMPTSKIFDVHELHKKWTIIIWTLYRDIFILTSFLELPILYNHRAQLFVITLNSMNGYNLK